MLVALRGPTHLKKELHRVGDLIDFCKVLARYSSFVRLRDDGNCMVSGSDRTRSKVKPIKAGLE